MFLSDVEEDKGKNSLICYLIKNGIPFRSLTNFAATNNKRNDGMRENRRI
jgi:hypothetical protein